MENKESKKNASTDSISNSAPALIVNQEEAEVLQVMLDNITVYLDGSKTNGDVFFGKQIIQPGDGVPPHYHTREDEVITLIKGSLEVTLDGEVTIMKPGDTVFLPKKSIHGYQVISEEAVETRLMTYPAGIEHMFRELADMEPLEDGGINTQLAAQICEKHGLHLV